MSVLIEQVMADAVVFGLSLVGLLGLVGVGEGLQRLGISRAVARHCVHAGVGVFAALTPVLFTYPAGVYLIAGCFVILNFAAWQGGRWAGIHAGRADSWGTVTFPLALIPALAICWSMDPGRLYALPIAFLILAFSDPLAAWIGRQWPRPGRIELDGAEKSIAGSTAFGASAFVICGALLVAFRNAGTIQGGPAELLAAALAVALATTAAEALGRRGWDNFFIVLAAIVPLVFLHDNPSRHWQLVGGAGAGIVFGILSFRAQWLSLSGAVAGGLLAASLIGLGGWTWAVPGFTFFILSSALSRLEATDDEVHTFHDEKGAVRDAGQVYANGAIAWALLLVAVVYPADLLLVGFLGAFAAAAADTWATELGRYSTRRPWSIRSGQRVPRGTSGAISILGTGAAVLGAATIPLSAWPVVNGTVSAHVVSIGGVVVLSGVAGAFMDSVLGATIQARYRDPATGQHTERAASDHPHVLVRGYPWITNDRVNWMGTAVGAGTSMLAVAFII